MDGRRGLDELRELLRRLHARVLAELLEQQLVVLPRRVVREPARRERACAESRGLG